MSGSAAKRKGSQYERDLVAAFRAAGFDAERCYGAGRPDDVGDIEIAGLPVVIEAKNHARLDLAGWTAEAAHEAANAGADLGVVIAKARGRNAAGSYLIVRLDEGGFELLHAYACTHRAGGEL